MSPITPLLCVIGLVVSSALGEPVVNKNPDAIGRASPRSDSYGCYLLGTASNPAYSCQHLKQACHVQSGDYYILSAGIYAKVYCEMDLQGEGWARYGRSNQGSVWNFVDQDATEITLDIISSSDVKEMIDLKYNRFLVQTDIDFQLRADDSVNPSRLTTRTIPWLEETDIFIPDYGNDHTRIEFVPGEADRITCIPGSTSKCGHGGTPRAHKKSKPLFFESLYFGPRADGASAYKNVWSRNRYTWKGNYYFVYAM